MNNILYIGLNGYAGSGKDTVAKMLKTILSNDWNSFEDCLEYYKKIYKDPTRSATFNPYIDETNSPVLSIAYADQLKFICSNIFGIPYERFYMNKSTAWICITKDFQYTEIRPDENQIITAEEYYYNNSDYRNSDLKYWMSLRDILVYVGTYVLQEDINKKIFVNIVRNKIKEAINTNSNLKYVICTDNRFSHEIDFIRENNGIMITITRNSVKQLDNIAEHKLDNVTEYDYTIENNGTYEELLRNIWDIVKNNIEFSNITENLRTREDINNYIRLVNNEENIWKVCAPLKIQKAYHNEGELVMIDPVGGPVISVDNNIDGTNKIPTEIYLSEIGNQFLVKCKDYTF